MTNFFFVIIVLIACLLPFYLFRAVVGPTIFDRLIGLNGISSKAVIFLVLIGAYCHQTDMFLDIGLGYGLLNLVSAVAVGKYLEKKGLKK